MNDVARKASNADAAGRGEAADAGLLMSAYPNPFNPRTTITLAMPEDSPIQMEVVDLLGRTVAVLADGEFPVGSHRFTWDATNVATGIYLIVARAGHAVVHHPIVVMR
jgi:hypothetical protein